MTTLTHASPTPASRTTRADLRAFPGVLRSEWIKLSSLRSNRALLALTAAIGAFSSWAVATLVTDEVLTVSRVFVYSTFLTAVMAAVAGILVVTSEVQHGTLASAFAARPGRCVVVGAKTVLVAAFGLVLAAAGMAAGWLGAVLAGLDAGDGSGVAATAGWALLFCSMAAVLGLGIGMVVRHSAAAISGLLVWWLVVENLLFALLPAEASRYLPFYTGGALLGVEVDTHTTETLAVQFDRPVSALVFAGYVLLALVVGATITQRRDVD